MRVYLQSFFSKPMATPYSIARYQPEGYNYSEIDIFKPLSSNGTPIKTSMRKVFLEAYCMLIVREYKYIERWVYDTNRVGEDITLCCWCDRDRKMVNGKLFCHSILVGYMIERFASIKCLDIEVVYLDGREEPIWTREEMHKEFERLLRR